MKKETKDLAAISQLYSETAVPMKGEDTVFIEPGSEVSEPKDFAKTGPNSPGADVPAPVNAELSGDNHYDSGKLSQNSEKNDKENINNSKVMSETNKNTFDELYENIMGSEDLGMGSDDLDTGVEDEMLGGDEVGDDLGGGGDPQELLSTAIDALQQLADVLGGGDEGDIPGEEAPDVDMGEELPEEEGVQQEMKVHADLQNLPDKGADNPKGSNAASGNLKKVGGSANTGNIKDAPVPQNLGGHGDRSHPDAGNVSAGSNKVNNPGTPGVGGGLYN